MPGDLLSDELVKIGCFPQSTLNRSPAKPILYAIIAHYIILISRSLSRIPPLVLLDWLLLLPYHNALNATACASWCVVQQAQAEVNSC